MVNNAGIGNQGQSFETCSLDEWNYHMQLNMTSVFLMTQLFTPNLQPSIDHDTQNGSYNGSSYDIQSLGNIVNIGSLCGIQVHTHRLPYCVSKAAIDHMTRCAAVELANKNIRVNCIRPSTVRTSFHENAGMTQQEADRHYDTRDYYVGSVNDVIQTILFLADNEKSHWITGQCITLDGGRTLQC